MADTDPLVGVVDLNLQGDGAPLVGVVDLNVAPPGSNARLVVAAKSGGSRSAIRIRAPSRVTLHARSGGSRAIGRIIYDPNLLSDVNARAATTWQPAQPAYSGLASTWTSALRQTIGGAGRWQIASLLPGTILIPWRDSPAKTTTATAAWRAAQRTIGSMGESWRQSPVAPVAVITAWRNSLPLSSATTSAWIMTLPLANLGTCDVWQDAALQTRAFIDYSGSGQRVIVALIERWRQAGYPGNAANPGPIVPIVPLDLCVGIVDLDLRCPPGDLLTGWVDLNLDQSPCPRIPAIVIPLDKVYRVLNSCSLVRLPDRAPLPVTSMTIETDTDSWCWSLTATLATARGWDLVQPQAPAFLPVEVEATINGHGWRFLLDQPSATHSFGQHRQPIKGRSRSAWLADPFTARSRGVEVNPRTAQQLAEQALANLGWALVWQLPVDWLIPGNLYSWSATPIEQLINLIKPVDGCLYTDPQAAIMTAYLRYPTPAWLWDGQIADLGIPAAALAALDRAPDHRPIINGCYVSGTQYGNIAWLKVAGTDGALVPPEPVVDPLLTSVDALRARGVSILSASGPGQTLSTALHLTQAGGSGPGLLRPGLLVEIAGTRGRIRSVRVTAEWAQALKVRQSVSIERREVEP